MDLTRALHFFRDAYGALYVHCPNMLFRSEWNLAGRTAYDAMEKVALAVEALSGIRRSKDHKVELSPAIVERVPLVAWEVESDPLRSNSLVVQKSSSPEIHIKLFKCIYGTLTLLSGSRITSLENVILVKDGSTIVVLSDDSPAATVTDTALGMDLDGRWVQIAIDRSQIGILNKYLSPLSKERNTSAYYGEVYSSWKARSICEDGKRLFVPIKQRVGHRRG